MVAVKYTAEEQRFCEQRSLENLVENYRQELLRIVGGDNDISLLPRGVRRRMRKDGILSKARHTFGVTPKGRDMLSIEAS